MELVGFYLDQVTMMLEQYALLHLIETLPYHQSDVRYPEECKISAQVNEMVPMDSVQLLGVGVYVYAFVCQLTKLALVGMVNQVMGKTKIWLEADFYHLHIFQQKIQIFFKIFKFRIVLLIMERFYLLQLESIIWQNSNTTSKS